MSRPHDHQQTAVSSDAPTTRARADIVAEICARIAGGSSVAEVFREPAADYPNQHTFWRWCADPEVERAYRDATVTRGEKYAEEIVAISDQAPPLERTQFGEKHDAGFVAWQKNRIEARKWVAARMLPKRYGDRTVIAGDADNPVHIVDDTVTGKLLPELAAGSAPTTPGESDT